MLTIIGSTSGSASGRFVRLSVSPSGNYFPALHLTSIFLVPASAPRLVQQRPWYVLSCLWDGAYKRTLAVNR